MTAATETSTERLARLRAAWANPKPAKPVSATERYEFWKASNPHPRDWETTDRLYAAMVAEQAEAPAMERAA
jgi:hypothetical protein